MKSKLVILSGAGMSVESGLSTFRNQGGLWNNHRIEDVCTPEAWYRNPKLVLDFYNDLRHKLYQVQPNLGHQLISELEKYYQVTVVTQNVDDLHERAGSTHVIHLHGELKKVRSERNPNLIYEVDKNHIDTQIGDKAEDGAQLRPHIVWFGEAVPKIEEATEAVSDADIFVIIGTSLNVYPAAGLINYVRKGVPIYLIDPDEVRSPYHQDIHYIQKTASEGMKELSRLLTQGH